MRNSALAHDDMLMSGWSLKTNMEDNLIVLFHYQDNKKRSYNCILKVAGWLSWLCDIVVTPDGINQV